jgi:hypothetical protein
MPNKVSDEIFIEAYHKHDGNAVDISAALKLDSYATRQRIKRMIESGRLAAGRKHVLSTAAELKITKEKLKAAEGQLLTDEYVRNQILRFAVGEHKPPQWTLELKGKASDLTGVPTLFASDWHWGEVVRPSEIGGTNEYNLDIARKRVKTLTSVTCELLTQHLSTARYPGVVLLLGGDMISGDIHEELKESRMHGCLGRRHQAGLRESDDKPWVRGCDEFSG